MQTPELVPIQIYGRGGKLPDPVMLPKSQLVKSQKRVLPMKYMGGKSGTHVRPTVRWDDQCGNGNNSFSVTADLFEKRNDTFFEFGGGCCHDSIIKSHPEIAHLIKWHMVKSDGPWGYIPNTIYHAGSKDCWGLEKGEFRQHTSRGPHQADGVAGIPCWELKRPELRETYSTTKPNPVVLEWVPYGKTGDGKERELDSARSSACWPEATDEQLMLPEKELEALLIERLPALMLEFYRDITEFGFTY